MEISPLLIGFVAIALFVIYLAKAADKSKGKSRKTQSGSKSSNSSQALLSMPAAHHWQDGRNFDFQVVGESFYQSHLSTLVGSASGQWVEVPHVATLVPEDDNAHDKSAVGIYIEGKPVGYLSRDDARSFRRRLGAKKLSGMPTTCDAIIKGGGSVKGKTAAFGVWLDMKPFD